MKEFELAYQGAILDENTVSPNDFILGGKSDLSVRIENIKPDNPKHYYDQSAQRRTRNGCTLYMAMGLISDLNGHVFTLEEILDIHNLAEKKYGWRENRGGYLYKAVDCVRTWWNKKYPENQLISFRVKLTSPEAEQLEEAGKSIGIGYRTTTEHYKDSQDNGSLDSKTFKGFKIHGGHAIRYSKGKNIDNYEGKKKHNTYKNKRLKDYVKDNTYFNEGYVFFEKEESIFKDLPKNHPFYKRVKSLYDKGIINGYDDGTIRVNDSITRGEVFILLDRILNSD